MRLSSPLPALSRDCALFLDIDGTLIDFSLSPGAVVVPHGLLAMLKSLQLRQGGALALLSGRRLGDIEALFGPGFAVGAEHGALLQDAEGQVFAEIRPSAALAALAVPLREAVAAHPGTLLEEKRFGLALHWRAAPETAGGLQALAARLAAPYPELLLLPAHAALEIRPRGTDKGSALASFMRQPPFAGHKPVFVGDDTTDEPAIARANEMGGLGLHVARDFGGATQAVRAWLAESLEREGHGDATA